MLHGKDMDKMATANALATFSCKHAITKRPICATPCNGISEMCEDDEDEKCQGPGLIMILASTLMFSMLFLCCAFLKDCLFYGNLPIYENEVIEMDQTRSTMRNDMNIFRINLLAYKHVFDFTSALQLVNNYNIESTSGIEHVDEYFMNVLGTNETSVFFYDCVNKSIIIRIGSYFQRNIPRMLLAMTNTYIQNIIIITQQVIIMSVRYSDLPKDVLFLYIIWIRLSSYQSTSFSMVIFWTLLLSITATEIVHCVSIMQYHTTTVIRKAINFLMAPLMPAFHLYEHMKLKMRLRQLCRIGANFEVTTERIIEYESKCIELELLSAEMQCTENILENLTQLSVLTIILSLGQTSTKTVENISATFLDDNLSLSYILATMSFMSMIRGQLTFLKANKNGCLSMTGTLVTTPYYVVGTCSK